MQKACVSIIQIMSTKWMGQDGYNFILHLMGVVQRKTFLWCLVISYMLTLNMENITA